MIVMLQVTIAEHQSYQSDAAIHMNQDTTSTEI